MRVTFRPTLTADLSAFITEPLPYRIQAITALHGDVVLGVGGLGFRPDGTVIAFAHISDEGKTYPRAIHRAGRLAMAMIERSGVLRVIATAQANNPAAEPWLLRLGFKRIEGHAAFVWERHTDVER